MKQFTLIDRPPDQVWDALTRAEHLTNWLAERAEVDLRPGGALSLASVTPFVSGDHTIATIEQGQAIHIDWNVEGVRTQVGFRLTPHEGGTKVLVTHRFPAQTPFPVDDTMGGECGVFHSVWSYACGLLKTYLELGEAKSRLPAEAVGHPSEVRCHLRLASAPSKVFRALTQASEIKKWNAFASGPSVDPRVGGRYSFGWKSEEQGTDGPDEIVEYEQDRKVTYTWHGKHRTLVSWEVEPLGTEANSGTRLTLVHSGFVSDDQLLLEYKLGWAGFLHCLVLALDRDARAGWNGYA